MNLSNKQIRNLEKIVASVQAIIEEAKVEKGMPAGTSGEKRVRRSGKDLAAFRKMLKAERKKGVPVADLARQHNISAAYIYQL